MDGKRLARILGMEADGQRREPFDHTGGRDHGRPVAGGDAFVAGAAFGQLADQVGARQLGLQQLLARSLELQRDTIAGHFAAELPEQITEHPARPVGLTALAGLLAAMQPRRLLLELSEDSQIMKISSREGHR